MLTGFNKSYTHADPKNHGFDIFQCSKGAHAEKGLNPVGGKPKIPPGPSIEALRLVPHVPTNCPACVLYTCM